ncbi:hypothetical protein AN218_13590 [Streptomyces nanshensis]|uniref:Uncharacterized protein n=1 Tax=Streptomyces nanshensis TaxID=518642 RepID=A0A1E7L521_9ACTN|nr:hypothetical protein AN218_13590 [Streptomyces nanshensis]
MGVRGIPAVTVEQALKVVGLTLDEVRDLGGSVLTAGPAYLVGSLAGGLGNKGSDVDVHLLVEGITKPTPAYLFFAGETPVDIEHYPVTMPAQLIATADAFPVRELPVGRVSLAPSPGRRMRRTASRWLNSLPLLPGQSPVFTEEEAGRVLPMVVRSALDQMLVVWAVARLAERADPGSDTAAYLFRRAGRELLELRCRAQGDVLTSEKWLPSRAARLGIDADLVRRHYAVPDEKELVALLADTGLADWDPWRLTTVREDPGRRTVHLGREAFALTRHGRVFADSVTADGSLHDAVDALAPDRLLRALRDAELVLEVSPDAQQEAFDE